MSQNQGRDVPLAEALTSYIRDVLRFRRDEATVINPPTEALTLPTATAATAEDDDWRNRV